MSRRPTRSVRPRHLGPAGRVAARDHPERSRARVPDRFHWGWRRGGLPRAEHRGLECPGSGVLATYPPRRDALCERGLATGATYNDKQCFEPVAFGRRLAVTAHDAGGNAALSSVLVDFQRGAWTPAGCGGHRRHGVHAFVLSSATSARSAQHAGRNVDLGALRPAARGTTGAVRSPRRAQARPVPVDGIHRGRLAQSHPATRPGLARSTWPPGPVAAWRRRSRTSGALRVSADGSRPSLPVPRRHPGGDRRGDRMQRGYPCPYFCNRMHKSVDVPYAVSGWPDGGERGCLGAGIWDTDADTLIAPLRTPPYRRSSQVGGGYGSSARDGFDSRPTHPLARWCRNGAVMPLHARRADVFHEYRPRHEDGCDDPARGNRLRPGLPARAPSSAPVAPSPVGPSFAVASYNYSSVVRSSWTHHSAYRRQANIHGIVGWGRTFGLAGRRR
jgi:hypothetical protein